MQSLDPGANPFGQDDLNAQTGNVNRMFQQVTDQLTEQATREGWLNTPRFEKEMRNNNFENILANQTNKTEYEQAKAGWSFQNRQIVSDYYQKYTDSETQNRNIKLTIKKILEYIYILLP